MFVRYWIFILGIILVTACEQEVPSIDNPLRYSNIVFDSVKVTKNIHYRSAFSITGQRTELFFDFSEPYGDSIQSRPLVILMHGGGFVQGMRSWMDSLSGMLPLYGYSCASISYRLYDGDKYPLNNEDFLESFIYAREDLIAAVNYFVNHASGIDPYKTDINNIFIAGSSAGAICALHAIPLDLSTTSNFSIIDLTNKIDANIAGPKVPIRGILSFAGAILDTSWITRDYPSILCVHGTSDKVVPYSEGFIQIMNIISPFAAFGSEIICNKASSAGLNSILIPDPGAGHDNFFKKPNIWKDQSISFLRSCLVFDQGL